MKNKLLPCPICGGFMAGPVYLSTTNQYVAKCQSCDLEISIVPNTKVRTLKAATRFFNTRTDHRMPEDCRWFDSCDQCVAIESGVPKCACPCSVWEAKK